MNSLNTTVLVTGATGFIAQHCVVQLLDAGYRVRGTARSAERAAKLKTSLVPHLAAGADAIDRFEIISADLTSDEGGQMRSRAAGTSCTWRVLFPAHRQKTRKN